MPKYEGQQETRRFEAGKHRRRDVSPFECEWVTINKSKPINNIDSIAKMAGIFVGFLVFCIIIGSLVIW